jgi:hypothetical protein
MVSVKTVKKSKYKCHDCKKEIKINNYGIKNGLLLTYEAGDDRLQVFKCNKCFTKNPSLTNFKKCEVYSRVVGYLRPVRQWNLGKRQEFKERKDFKLKVKDLN